MQIIEITCAKNNPFWPSLHNCASLSGPSGHWTRDELVTLIQSKTASVFITVNGRRSDLAVFPQGSITLVRSHANGVWNDDLLALPQCQQVS